MDPTGKFSNFWFFGFLSTTPFKTIQIENVGSVLKKSGNFQQHFEPPLKFNLFWAMSFFNLFHAYMVQKYQNESAPIFYYGKSPKTNRKHLKILYLQALTLGHIIKMTL